MAGKTGARSVGGLDARAVGLACGVTGITLYVACAVLVAVWPSGALALFNSLLHGIDLTALFQPGGGAGRFLLGALVSFIGGTALGGLFATVYNRLVTRE